MKYVFLIFFSLIPVVSGYTGLFSILDEQYISDISDLPYSPGTPQIKMQEQGNINAWIDIVGFKDITRIDGIDYTISKPESLALIQYEAFVDPPGILDSLDKSISVYQSGNYTIASLHVVMTWHKMCRDKRGSYVCGRYTEEQDFEDSELSPLIYPSIKNGSASIIEYNNSINPHAAIGLNLPGNISISKVTYRYGSDSLTHYFGQGHVERTEKGIYFLNLSVVDFWTANTESLQHFNEWVMIPNSSSPNYSNLSIRVSDPYEARTIDNYSFERITYNSGSTFSNPLLMFVGMISTFIFMAIIAIRRV